MAFVNGFAAIQSDELLTSTAAAATTSGFSNSTSLKESSTSTNGFSLLRLRDLVVKCVREESGETDTVVFLDMYREMLKFMCSLGRLYAFAATDIRYKLNVLTDLYDKDNDNYSTIECMVQHECLNEKGKQNNQDGTKNFLWLHRALEFVVQFIEALRINILFKHQHRFSDNELSVEDLSEQDRDKWMNKSVQEIVWDVYSSTLSVHHGWIVKQLVHVASYASPSQDQMVKIFGGDSKSNLLKLNEWVDEIVNHGRRNFKNMDIYFESKGLRLLY